MVQGVSKGEPELLDVAALVGHLVPSGSVFAFLAEHRRRVSAMMRSLICSPPGRVGRRSRPM